MPCGWCNSTGGECGCNEGYCVHCGGTGHVAPPPFGDGSTFTDQHFISYIAKAASDLRCIGDSGMIYGTAYKAAKIHLPANDVKLFMEYWAHPYRDCNLGEYISQIAERALALKSKL